MFLNQIFDNKERPISDGSKKLYTANLTKLNDGNDIVNFIFLKKPSVVMKKIEHLKPTTQRSYIIAICSVINNNVPKKLYDEYYIILMDFNRSLKDRTDKTETQKENWMTVKEIQDVELKLETKIKKFRQNRLNKNEYSLILQHMILSLFTKIQPRRNKDYSVMKITNSNKEDKKFNYLDMDNKKFIFNNYKTSHTYNTVQVDIPDDLFKIIVFYLKFHKERNKLKNKSYNIDFLVGYSGEAIQSNDVTKNLNKTFGKNVSSSMLRNIFLSDKYTDMVNELDEDTKAMGTSIDVALSTYVKSKN